MIYFYHFPPSLTPLAFLPLDPILAERLARWGPRRRGASSAPGGVGPPRRCGCTTAGAPRPPGGGAPAPSSAAPAPPALIHSDLFSSSPSSHPHLHARARRALPPPEPAAARDLGLPGSSPPASALAPHPWRPPPFPPRGRLSSLPPFLPGLTHRSTPPFPSDSATPRRGSQPSWSPAWKLASLLLLSALPPARPDVQLIHRVDLLNCQHLKSRFSALGCGLRVFPKHTISTIITQICDCQTVVEVAVCVCVTHGCSRLYQISFFFFLEGYL